MTSPSQSGSCLDGRGRSPDRGRSLRSGTSWTALLGPVIGRRWCGAGRCSGAASTSTAATNFGGCASRPTPAAGDGGRSRITSSPASRAGTTALRTQRPARGVPFSYSIPPTPPTARSATGRSAIRISRRIGSIGSKVLDRGFAGRLAPSSYPCEIRGGSVSGPSSLRRWGAFNLNKLKRSGNMGVKQVSSPADG